MILPKLLYVDDEFINVEFFELNFRNHFEVLTAFSGEEGLVLVKNHKDIKVVVSDMRMPNMNGLEFITEARKINFHLKCFILSGYELSSDLKEALKEGAILNFFQKPYSLTDVLKGINKELIR